MMQHGHVESSTAEHMKKKHIEYYRKKFRSLEVKLPTIWTDDKAEVGRVREEKRRREKKREDTRRERIRRQKMQVHEKAEKCF